MYKDVLLWIQRCIHGEILRWWAESAPSPLVGRGLRYLVSQFFFSEFDCECIKWDQCSWSNDAFIRAKGLSRESEEYEEIKEKIRKHTCGESSQHMVYCCTSNQGSPDEINALETGIIVLIGQMPSLV